MDFTKTANICGRAYRLAAVRDGDVFAIGGQKYYVKGEAQSVRGEWLVEFGG